MSKLLRGHMSSLLLGTHLLDLRDQTVTLRLLYGDLPAFSRAAVTVRVPASSV